MAEAVPSLALSGDVTVVTVDRDPDDTVKAGVADVAVFLGRHGIKAQVEIINADDEDEKLSAFVKSDAADLLISGAYGHDRIREFVFGEVTRSLLEDKSLNRFMAS